MEETIINILMFSIPSVITGGIAYYFFKEHIESENNQRQFVIQKELQKETLPIRLQAYERMALLLERISPSKLLVRVHPTSSNKEDYENLLVATIEQEFEHNLSQQIYVSDRCWNVITAAKNTTIQLIRKANMHETTDSANKLREVILTDLMDKQPPSEAALSFIKDEVGAMW